MCFNYLFQLFANRIGNFDSLHHFDVIENLCIGTYRCLRFVSLRLHWCLARGCLDRRAIHNTQQLTSYGIARCYFSLLYKFLSVFCIHDTHSTCKRWVFAYFIVCFCIVSFVFIFISNVYFAIRCCCAVFALKAFSLPVTIFLLHHFGYCHLKMLHYICCYLLMSTAKSAL